MTDEGALTSATRAVAARPARSLATRLVLPLVASSVAVVVGVVALMYGLASSQLADQVEVRGRFLLNAVRYASETKAGFGDLLRQVNALGGQRDVRLIAVAQGSDDIVVAGTRRAWVGGTLATGPGTGIAELARAALAQRSQVAAELPELGVIAVAGPTLLFTSGGTVTEGVVVVAIDLSGVRTDLLRQTAILALMVLLGVAASAGLSVFLVHRSVLAPAHAMRRAVQRQEEVPVHSDDELGAVANALNRAFSAAETRRAELGVAAGRLAVLVRQFPAGVLVEDEKRRIVLVNDTFCELFMTDSAADALVGRSAPLLIADASTLVEGSSGFRNRIEAIVAAGTIVDGDEIRLVDGRILERAYQPILAEGTLQGHLWVYRDVTGRMRDAELMRSAKDTAEEATRAKADFLATMSHEIRTPLNGVVGMADLLIEAELTASVREQVDIIRASGRHLLSLINDILDYSRIEAGRLQLERIDFDPWAIAEEVLSMQVPAARSKDLTLHLEVAPGVPARLRGDPSRLRQILVNLSGNAVKFTSTGGITVRLDHLGTEMRPLLVVEVIDTGIGIPADILPQLFQPFTQADSSTSRRFGGTGLGLAICKRLAELMGGAITVTSRDGQSSVFRVVLPYERGGHPTALELPEALAHASIGLVIADRANAILVARSLDSFGIRSADADHAATVLITDGHAGQARAAMGVGAVPVVGLGGDVAQEFGWAAVVTPPVRRARLFDALHAAVSGHSSVHADGLPRWPGLRVLVADDVAVNRIVAQRMLQRHELVVEVVEDGLAAVDAVARQRFDLVLMDCHMPNLDGFGATKAISDRGQHPPIIALTADSLEGDRERCLAAGMDDYLAKPITSESLRAILERWLGPAAGAPASGAPATGPRE